jgi:3-keto-L-gulonate-6-phosphate decarboxylase
MAKYNAKVTNNKIQPLKIYTTWQQAMKEVKMITCQLMHNLMKNNNVRKILQICANLLFHIHTLVHHVQQDNAFLISIWKLNNIRSFVEICF